VILLDIATLKCRYFSMNRIQGLSRQQVEFGCLEDTVSNENPVRVMDAFVDKLDLSKLGFVQREARAEGRPAFENETFLKIYLYGYVNGIRSSRKLGVSACEMWRCIGL
jgi:transposase